METAHLKVIPATAVQQPIADFREKQPFPDKCLQILAVQLKPVLIRRNRITGLCEMGLVSRLHCLEVKVNLGRTLGAYPCTFRAQQDRLIHVQKIDANEGPAQHWREYGTVAMLVAAHCDVGFSWKQRPLSGDFLPRLGCEHCEFVTVAKAMCEKPSMRTTSEGSGKLLSNRHPVIQRIPLLLNVRLWGAGGEV
eukprot:1611442-Amphidinium_carterae.1